MSTMKTYRIKNSNGLSGPTWDAVYESYSEAAEAIRYAYGWNAVVLGPEFTESETSYARCAYPTQDECDADETGTRAPWVVESCE